MHLLRKLLPTALLLVEGETEEELYTRFVTHYATKTPKYIKNLRVNFNINRKIIDAAASYMERNQDRLVDVFVCIDQERLGVPAFSYQSVVAALQHYPNFRSLTPIVVVLTIESVFFLDINGIYTFLRAKRSSRKPHKFATFRALTHVELARLFRQCGKTYYKGHRCEGLVAALDLDKLLKAEELCLLKEALESYRMTR